MIRLWTINRWLRWVGIALLVHIPGDETGPVLIGLQWVGLPPKHRGWHRRCERLGHTSTGPGPFRSVKSEVRP